MEGILTLVDKNTELDREVRDLKIKLEAEITRADNNASAYHRLRDESIITTSSLAKKENEIKLLIQERDWLIERFRKIPGGGTIISAQFTPFSNKIRGKK